MLFKLMIDCLGNLLIYHHERLILTLLIAAVSLSFAGNISSPDKPIVVSSSRPEFEVRLASNPGSTGYIWFLKSYNSI